MKSRINSLNFDITTFMKTYITVPIVPILLGLMTVFSFQANALTQQEAEELAEFRATMVFLRSDCKIEMSDNQFNDGLLFYALQRGWYLGNYAQFDLDKLTLNRYKDLASIGLDKTKKCEGLQKSMAPILKKLG